MPPRRGGQRLAHGSRRAPDAQSQQSGCSARDGRLGRDTPRRRPSQQREHATGEQRSVGSGVAGCCCCCCWECAPSCLVHVWSRRPSSRGDGWTWIGGRAFPAQLLGQTDQSIPLRGNTFVTLCHVGSNPQMREAHSPTTAACIFRQVSQGTPGSSSAVVRLSTLWRCLAGRRRRRILRSASVCSSLLALVRSLTSLRVT
jgi:hypothetical protein